MGGDRLSNPKVMAMGMEGLKYVSSQSSMGCHLLLHADFPGPSKGQGGEWPEKFSWKKFNHCGGE